jgi:hypothetical protein
MQVQTGHNLSTSVMSRTSEMNDETDRKIRKAVLYINSKKNDAIHVLVEIGNYILQEFYDDDLAKYRNRAPRKGVSVRKLAEEKDINMSYRSLCNAVNLAIQERRFFRHNDVFRSLTESHKLLLLSIDDDAEKIYTAKRVIENKWSVRTLREVLIEGGYIQRQGRPWYEEKNQAVYKNLLRVFSPFQNPQWPELDTINLDRLSDSERNKLKETILIAKVRMEELINQLI